MSPLLPGFLSGSYQSQSPNVSCQRCVNLYPETTEAQESETQAALYPTPGKTAFVDTTFNGCRGLFDQDGSAFGVLGSRLVELFAGCTATDRGADGNDALPATISSNRTQLYITSASEDYIFTLATNALAVVA